LLPESGQEFKEERRLVLDSWSERSSGSCFRSLVKSLKKKEDWCWTAGVKEAVALDSGVWSRVKEDRRLVLDSWRQGSSGT